MKMWKLGVIVTCSCLVTIPALAKEQPASGARPQGAAIASPEAQNFNYSKEAYMEQVGKSLDKLDKNRDGKIDAAELAAGSDNDDDDSGLYDEDPFEDTANNATPKEARTLTAPASGVAPSAGGVGGVPPVNADQLLNK